MKHSAINFQNVQFGQKIREIQIYIKDKLADNPKVKKGVDRDLIFVEEPLDDFNYVFSNLELANMMEFS